MILTTNLFSQSLPSYVPKEGLLGWWPFNGNANDESGNGNHGIVNGANLTADKNGEPNKAYLFDGENDFITLKSSNTLTLESSFSMSVNFYLDIQKSSAFGLISKGAYNYDVEYLLWVEDDLKQIRPVFGNVILNKQLEVKKWHNITVIFDSNNSTGKVFLDNTLISKKVVNLKLNTGNAPLIFGAQDEKEWFFNGVIDDIAIYDRALTDLEVNQLYVGCKKETAVFNTVLNPIYKNSPSFILSAQPNGGVFRGMGIYSNQFEPSKAKLGTNIVEYVFINTSGCKDSTSFSLIVSDTIGQTCTKTIYDTITTHQTVTDTLKIKVGLTTGLFVNQQHLIQMYPNPTASDLLIDFGNQEKLKGYSLIISDISGKQVYKEDIQNHKSIVKLSSLGGKGVYVVNILDGNSKVLVVKQIILE
jgi:hypothetical protein